MTRPDYYLVAEALAKCKSLGQENLEYVADMLARDMKKADPTFKRELFMRVSGVEKAGSSDQNGETHKRRARKILFLDIDGVVNCKDTVQRHRGAIGIDPYMAFIVGKIQLDTDCEVVLSSTWRHMEATRQEVREQVVNFIDVTPDLWDRPRGEEIKQWLDHFAPDATYAILDDNSDMLDEQMPNFFQTSWDQGITPEIAKAVTEHLNG